MSSQEDVELAGRKEGLCEIEIAIQNYIKINDLYAGKHTNTNPPN